MKAPGRLTPGREGREGVQPGPRAPLGWPFWPCPQPRPLPPPHRFLLKRSLELYFLLDVNMLFKKKYLNIYISTLEVVLFKWRERQCGVMGWRT